jgi:hypothetical protein
VAIDSPVFLVFEPMSAAEVLAPTLLMVALLALIVIGLLIWVRTSRALQAERDEQRRVQTRLTLEKLDAQGRSSSLQQGLSATSQACRQAVQQLPLESDAKSLALGLMNLLPKLPVPVDYTAPYRQTLRDFSLELNRLEMLVAVLKNDAVTQRWVHGSYQDLCEIPSLLLPEEHQPEAPDGKDALLALARLHADPAADKSGLHHPVQRPDWDGES